MAAVSLAILISVLLVASKTALLASEISPHKSASCGCEDEFLDGAKYWLDIIFVMDTSNGVSPENFNAMKEFLKLTASMNVDHDAQDPRYTRIAVINVASEAQPVLDLKTPRTAAQVRDGITAKFNQLGGPTFKAQSGLKMAQDWIIEDQQTGTRANVRKVVVLFSTLSIDCKKQEKASNLADDADIICELVSVMEGDAITLITVGLKLAGEQEFPYIDIANKCNTLDNTESMISDFMRALCLANCYCLEPYTQYVIGEDGCNKFSECLYVEQLSLPYHSAKSTCHDQNNTLPLIVSKEKEEFLLDMHLQADFYPYWIGLTCNAGGCTMDDDTQVSDTEYTNWCTDSSQPNFNVGECVYQKQCNKLQTGWFSEKCGKFIPSHYFSCQAEACSISNYCDYVKESKKISARKVSRRSHRP